MSRALDDGTAASLANGNAAAAYAAISQALNPTTTPAADLVEIEMLGAGYEMPPETYVLRDESALGVSKLGLVQAFLVARRLLAGETESREEEKGRGKVSRIELLAATAVILLMDPEHLTAANTRKRLFKRFLLAEPPPPPSEIRVRIEAERWLVDSLLTSRLHRHTKSPTLWSHRRWLTATSHSLGLPVDVLRDITGVVAVAGERHPRNYYAWSHARWLVGLNSGEPKEEMSSAIKDWCLRHRNDISGWSFLSFLLLSADPGRKKPETASAVFEEVLRLARSLRWTNESVWVFLQAMASPGFLEDRQYADLRKTCMEMARVTPVSEEQTRLEALASWCGAYGHKGPR